MDVVYSVGVSTITIEQKEVHMCIIVTACPAG